jgi:hypothetical protein
MLDHVHAIHRGASITVNLISLCLDTAFILVLRGPWAFIFGILFLVLSACGLYGAIVYRTGPIRVVCWLLF